MIYNSSKNSGILIAKSIASYTLLPGFWSRFTDLTPRFGMLAYLIATIFESIKLLPPGHAFSNASQMGTFRIRDVLAASANNLHGGFKNSDQYIVFGAVSIGVILLLLQFVFLMAMILTKSAEAAIPFVGMFVTVEPELDIAHLMLDKVFGIPNFFNSCFDPAVSGLPICIDYKSTATFPDPFQQGLQALFRFYSMGMLIVASFVFLYFIFAVIIETANTGVPFGSRFQSVFTPLRIVIAVLLLLPLANGYNTGQWIVLLSAKWGSALATNSWLSFNNLVGDNPMGMEPKQLVGKPKVGDIDSTLNFMYLAQTCKAAYMLGVEDVNPITDPAKGVSIEPYLIRSTGSLGSAASQQLTAATTFTDSLTFSEQADIQIVFGEKNAVHTDYPGQVKPYCGIILMPSLSKKVPGIVDLYNVYFKNINDMWVNPDLSAYGKRMACAIKFSSDPSCSSPAAVSVPWGADDKAVAGPEFYIGTRTNAQANFTSQMDAQIDTMRNTVNPQLTMDAQTLKRGWGGAGLWFDKVMQFNGAVVDALDATPTPIKYPMIMEHVAAKKRQASPNISQQDVFSLTMPEGPKSQPINDVMSEFGGNAGENTAVANVLNSAYKQIQDSEATSKPKVGNTDNPIKNFVKLLFGQSGIFDFRGNSEVFPLAKLAMFGRELINKTIIMLAAKGLMQGAGGIIGADLGPMGEIIKNFGPGIGSFTTIGLSLGILLYYVVPLMPFIYFFFAVGRWVKSIFEAMIAIPLWALAHLRLGGDGIPGPAAGQGYFLILEILLRPIFTLFGLMASIATFMALTVGLDSVFNLAVMNVGGFDMTTISSGGTDLFADVAREGMDMLFYTAIYAMLVYMIATSSFKLIDILPNAVMRWGGTNTMSFNDQTDPMSEISKNLVYKADAMARGISQVGDDVAGRTNFDDKSRLRDSLKG